MAKTARVSECVEEFIIDSVYSVFLQGVIKTSVDIFSLGEIGKKFNVEYLRKANPQNHGMTFFDPDFFLNVKFFLKVFMARGI